MLEYVQFLHKQKLYVLSKIIAMANVVEQNCFYYQEHKTVVVLCSFLF